MFGGPLRLMKSWGTFTSQLRGGTLIDTFYVNTPAKAEEALKTLLVCPRLAVDTEGVRLSRFGRLCVVQVFTGQQAYVFDALVPSVIPLLKPVLESPFIQKVFHDVREDGAALFNQYAIQLTNIHDTQKADLLAMKAQGEPGYQSSLADLCDRLLGVPLSSEVRQIQQVIKYDEQIFYTRPIPDKVLAYCLHDVVYLLALQAQQSRLPPEQMQDYLNYAAINLKFQGPRDLQKIGLKIQGMLTSRSLSVLYFKLNMGPLVKGVCSRPGDLKDFDNVQVGDLVDVTVDHWSANGDLIFLRRSFGPQNH